MSTAHDMQPKGVGLDVKVTMLEGQLALLAKEVSMSSQANNSTMMTLAADMRDVSKMVQLIRSEQDRWSGHSEGLARLGKNIEKLTEKLEKAEEDKRTRDESINTFKGGVKVLWAVVLIMGSLASAYVLNEFDHGEERDLRIENRIDRLENAK